MKNDIIKGFDVIEIEGVEFQIGEEVNVCSYHGKQKCTIIDVDGVASFEDHFLYGTMSIYVFLSTVNFSAIEKI